MWLKGFGGAGSCQMARAERSAERGGGPLWKSQAFILVMVAACAWRAPGRAGEVHPPLELDVRFPGLLDAVLAAAVESP